MYQRTLALVVLSLGICSSSPPSLEGQERFPDPPPGHGLYSDAVRVGDLVFLSGVVSIDSDPATQFRQVFERLGSILEGAGSSMDRVVDITTYHIAMHDHIDEFIAVKNEFMSELPTWTAVGVTELYSPGVFIEIKVIAAVADSG